MTRLPVLIVSDIAAASCWRARRSSAAIVTMTTVAGRGFPNICPLKFVREISAALRAR
jgi:hypothetical protein